MELIFWTKLQFEGLQHYEKYTPLQVLPTFFAQSCSYLKKVYRRFRNFYFPRHLFVAALTVLRFLKIHIQKMLSVSNGNLIELKWRNISNIKCTAINSKSWSSSLLYIQQRNIQNPIKRLRQSFFQKIINSFRW